MDGMVQLSPPPLAAPPHVIPAPGKIIIIIILSALAKKGAEEDGIDSHTCTTTSAPSKVDVHCSPRPGVLSRWEGGSKLVSPERSAQYLRHGRWHVVLSEVSRKSRGRYEKNCGRRDASMQVTYKIYHRISETPWDPLAAAPASGSRVKDLGRPFYHPVLIKKSWVA